MRFIQKGQEPDTLRQFKAMANPPNWEPTYDSLPKMRKDAIKQALIEEQKGLCCYCECILSEPDSHIEHFMPQHPFQDRALDYNNMHCSCMADQVKGTPLHCGMAKGNWYDDKLLISPLDPNCESHFKYLGDGSICPTDDTDAAAIETVKHLRLDDKGLTAARKAVIDTFLDETLSDVEREKFLADYIAECDSRPSEFISAVKSVMQV